MHELKEENGTYYTEDGTDIKTVIREEVWKDPIFPYEAKEDYAQAVCGWIQEVAEWGWQNVPDMVLSIGYSSAGLHDLGQDFPCLLCYSGGTLAGNGKNIPVTE